MFVTRLTHDPLTQLSVLCCIYRWPAMVECDPDFNTYQDMTIGKEDFVSNQIS